jgi:DNA-binding response OmpR family regulator
MKPDSIRLQALIVDDEQEIGELLTQFLAKEGVGSQYADRISKAKTLMGRCSFDLYLLDLNLPDGTGFDLIPDIRLANADARIIVISAYDGLNEMNRAKELHVDQFIRKPFSKKVILEMIAQLI